MIAPREKVTSEQVEDAYQAFAALRRQACAEPHLLENEFYKALQDTAYARFLMRLEAL